jgi:hypothetical protein
MRDVAFAQFTSESTAAAAVVELGFVPDMAIVIFDAQGTNPNMRLWFNISKSYLSNAAAGSDDSILMTGSTGVYTLDTASIAAYSGGDTVASADVTAGLYHNRAGTVQAAGHITAAGLSIPAGDQVNSGKNIIIAFRGDV